MRLWTCLGAGLLAVLIGGTVLACPVRVRTVAPVSFAKKSVVVTDAVVVPVAQTVAARRIEAVAEQFFHRDSYGYRPGRGAHDALAVARERCWRLDWVVETDIANCLGASSHCSFR